MQKRTIVVIVMLALIVSAGLAVAAGKMQGGRAPGMMAQNGACPMMGPMMVKELGLSDAQLTQMRALHKEFLDVTQATRDQMKEKCKAIAALWAAENPDAAQIKTATAEMDALRADIRNTGIDYLVKSLAILTPQQREKVRSMIANRPDMCPCPGCPMGMTGMGCGMGFGMCGGMGQGGGMGCGMGNATGPRARMGTCPRTQ
jgi:Spy/CpxP family protein refolding chaperone